MPSDYIEPVPAELKAALTKAIRLHREDRYAEAEAIYRKAAEAAPNHAVILGSWGTVLLEMNKAAEAVDVLGRALDVAPDYVLVMLTMAKACNKLGRFERSLTYCERARALDDKVVDVNIVLGDTLRLLDRVDESLAAYGKALAADPGNVTASMGIAYCRFTRGEHEAAVDLLADALKRRPDSTIGHWTLSQFLLLLGRYEEGWELFDWRWRFGDTPPPQDYVGRPVWTGEPLDGKTIIVWHEQGLGDELLFSTCLPDLLATANPGKVYLACDRRLIGLYDRTFPGLEFLPMDKGSGRGWQVTLPEFDVQVAAGDLPRFFRRSAEDFPAHLPDFAADPEKAVRWCRRLDALGPGPKVGIAWRGGVEGIFGRKKSTSLTAMLPILRTPGVRFVNVQYGDVAADLRDLAEAHGIVVHDWDDLDTVSDPDDQMAQISCLDLVVQTSNASAHMAGILGVPVWNMIPYFPDWRWSISGETCRWYPSMRLFRQPAPGDWPAVFEIAAAELARWSSKAGGR